MIKKICLGVIRFEIGGLQRKLGQFQEVGLGRDFLKEVSGLGSFHKLRLHFLAFFDHVHP